jgi:hypothetical protein
MSDEKEFPRNYPSSVVDILEAMSLSGGKGMRVIGSASLRSIQFVGDYDANETIQGSPEKVAKGLQGVVRKLQKLPDVIIGDIKCGGTMDEPLRWTPAQIIAGKNGHTTLTEAVSQDAMKKIDAVGLVGGRYVELSVVYLFPRESLDNKALAGILKEEIKAQLAEKNYWKAMKRFFSLNRLTNLKKAESMVPIFNGDMGRLYSVITDIATLLYLLENKQGSTEKMRAVIDDFRARLANIWRLKAFIKKEPGFDKAIDDASQGSPQEMMKILRRLAEHFNEVLQAEASLLVKKWKVA